MSEEIRWWKPEENIMQRRHARSRQSKSIVRPQGKTKRIYPPWTAEKEKQLIALYPDHSNAEVAAMLGLKEKSIQSKACKLKLFKTPEFHADRREKSKFRKGHVPANKGKKLSAEQYELMRPTMFKKGQPARNEVPVGTLTVRTNKQRARYRYIKIGYKKWVEYYRYIWEQTHGKIPDGGVVRHINGDTLDDRIENLELITKKENALKNSASLNLSDGYVANTLAWHDPEGKAAVLKHPELIELKRTQLKLGRAIKSKTSKPKKQ